MRIAYIVGTRPNFVKMAPVIAALRRHLPGSRHAIVHTGAALRPAPLRDLLRGAGSPGARPHARRCSGTHAVQTARTMERLERVLQAERPDLVLVPGDVNSTLAATLVAAKLGLRLGHVESGLRNTDRNMPEEVNRIVADEFSDLLFLHSEEAIENLRREGIDDARMHFVGNTMIDSLVAVEERFRTAGVAARFGLRPRDYLLVTLHRPALVDGPLLCEAFAQLDRVAHELPVLFPVHPRTRRRMSALGIETAVLVVEPVGYLDFLSLEAAAAAVLTASGGVQEETTFLGVPCFTLRDNTERPVTIRLGTNTLLGLEPERIADVLPALRSGAMVPREPPPLWDGQAAERLPDVVVGAAASLAA